MEEKRERKQARKQKKRKKQCCWWFCSSSTSSSLCLCSCLQTVTCLLAGWLVGWLAGCWLAAGCCCSCRRLWMPVPHLSPSAPCEGDKRLSLVKPFPCCIHVLFSALFCFFFSVTTSVFSACGQLAVLCLCVCVMILWSVVILFV